jgi:PAS domain S-box-containing protein
MKFSRHLQAMRHRLERLLQSDSHQQVVQVLNARQHVAVERQTYQDLFEFAPVGYLLTTPDGVIRRTNQAAARLFEMTGTSMLGQSLALFVPDSKRWVLRQVLAQLPSMEGVQEWHTQLQPWRGPAFDVTFRIAVVRGNNGRPGYIRWMLRKTTHERAVRTPEPGHAR